MTEWRANWTSVLAAGLGMAAGISMFASVFGFFIVPLQQEFGWSRTQLATASLAVLSSSLLMPVIGALLDRVGARRLAAVGAVAVALTYASLAFNPGELWLFYLSLLAIALVAAPATSPLVFAKPIVTRFNRSRGMALGLGLSGSYLLVIVVAPALQWVIGAHGWRVGFGLLAVMSLALGLLAAVLLGPHAPPAQEELGDEAAASGLREAMGDRRFWLLAAAMILASLPLGGLISQLQPLLADRNVPAATAGLLGAWYAACIVIGRLGTGVLLDRIWPPGVGTAALAVPSIGMLLLASGDATVLTLGAALACIGLAHGAESDLVSFFAARYFGSRSFGVIAGALGLMIGVSIGIGGLAFAYVADRFGNYGPALTTSAALMAASAVLLLMSGIAPARRRAVA